MTAVDVFSFGLAAAFTVLATWTITQWRRWRTRSTAYLALGFGSLALAIVISRLDELTPLEVWDWLMTSLNVVLAAFPWLVAASVWTLEGRRPRWAWIGLIWVPVTAVLFGFLFVTEVTLPGPVAFGVLAVFAVTWMIAAIGTAVRLRRAARRHMLARPRMRLMSTGLVVLTIALLIDLAAGDSPLFNTVMNAVALVAALLFVLGFVPPRALRLWWRRDTVATFQQMQVSLLGAVSAHEVGEAVAQPVAEVLGSGVVVVEEDGSVLASHGLEPDAAAEVAVRVAAREALAGNVRTTPIGRGWLAVVSGPFTPVFGRDEVDLVDAYAMQVRISLERAALFESVRRQQADLEAMLLGLAHDIRSPTAAISGSAQLLADADDRALREQLSELIGNSTDYLARLVDAMMELGQVSSGARDREPVALLNVAGQVGGRVSAAHPGVAVEVTGDDDAAVLMNPIRAEQLFENLIGNAVKHGGRDDLTVCIEVRDDGEEVVLVVADDGVGIEPDDYERIFAPFQRGRGARGKGNGLGLGLVQRIVDDLGGDLGLEPSDRGARFVVRLPTEHVPGPVLAPDAAG
ncbi:MAG TPA: ATP-binding protein [Egicoccus sp.]|nr:ATP-binding protein [Egicoccus sp.]HSK21754.1 ATP-binding protein [Egicoccus sp.]